MSFPAGGRQGRDERNHGNEENSSEKRRKKEKGQEIPTCRYSKSKENGPEQSKESKTHNCLVKINLLIWLL